MQGSDRVLDWFEPCAWPRIADWLASGWLTSRRWFGSKARSLADLTLADFALFPIQDRWLFWGHLGVALGDGSSEAYFLYFGLARQLPVGCTLLLRIADPEGQGWCLYEGTDDAELIRPLWNLLRSQSQWPTRQGRLVGQSLRSDLKAEGLPVTVLGGEQSNTNLRIGDAFLCKLFRRYVAGPNPDYEVTLFLWRRTGFRHVPCPLGAIHYAFDNAPDTPIIQVHEWIADARDAWTLTVETFSSEWLGGQPLHEPLDFVLLGRRTGELHLALASALDEADFAPEPLTLSDLQRIVDRMHQLFDEGIRLLPQRLPDLPNDVRDEARRYLESADRVKVLMRIPPLDESLQKIRIHGDYHLGQVLCTPQKDFVIVDFEGEPGLPLELRRAKSSPAKDVAGMLRSFDYAAQAAAQRVAQETGSFPEPGAVTRRAAEAASAFLRGYYAAIGPARFCPTAEAARDGLLRLFVTEKALYELLYELNNRPGWVGIPLRGILRLIEGHLES